MSVHARFISAPRRSLLSEWFIFPTIFLAVVAAHSPLLRLPYYWDEAGYYIPAAYDFFRTGSLIPFSTLSNAHPPLPSIYLAALWKLFGFSPLVTRVGMCCRGSGSAHRHLAAGRCHNRKRVSCRSNGGPDRDLSDIFCTKLARACGCLRRCGDTMGDRLPVKRKQVRDLARCRLLFPGDPVEGNRHRHAARSRGLGIVACCQIAREEPSRPRGRSLPARYSTRSLVPVSLAQAPALYLAIPNTFATTPQPRSRRCAC